MGHLMLTVANVAKTRKELQNGYRIVVNDNLPNIDPTEHLQIHVLGGEQ